jgi:hypothetical protein
VPSPSMECLSPRQIAQPVYTPAAIPWLSPAYATTAAWPGSFSARDGPTSPIAAPAGWITQVISGANKPHAHPIRLFACHPRLVMATAAAFTTGRT